MDFLVIIAFIVNGVERIMQNEYSGKRTQLIKRFFPYLKKYRKTMYLDLFCAALTCLCDVVLPLILRTITNLAMTDLASLTVSLVGKLALPGVRGRQQNNRISQTHKTQC